MHGFRDKGMDEAKKKSKQERRVDALALGGEEGRDKLRKAVGRCK